MKKRKFHFSRAAVVALVSAIALACGQRVLAEEKASNDGAAAEGKHRAAITRFLAGPIPRLELEIKEEDVEALRNEPKRYVEGVIHSEGKLYRGMAVKLKGADGSFRPIDEKPCFTIHTDKFKGGERFHGLKKFHLNNAREDSSFLRQMIAGEMARVAGVPALRCAHAIVRLNGRDLGLYVLAEGYTKDFLAQFYADPTGDLYEGGFCKDIDEELTKDEGDPKDFKAIKTLLAACREEEAAKRWSKLKGILDTDRFASFLAAESLLGVGDGYDFFRNNYRMYHDPKSRLLSFIPHSMDQPLSDAGFPIQRSPESIVGRAFVSCREGRELYRERVGELYEKIWVKRDWPARIKEAGEKVRAAVESKRAKALVAPMEELRKIVVDRKGTIAEQLAQLPAPLKFSPDGTVQLSSDWAPKQEGDARLDRSKMQGQDCLRVIAEGQVQASWRRSVQLDAGRYRFQARVKTVGVRDGDGAGLRISGRDPAGEWIAGDSGWKAMDYEFEVAEDGGEVVLVAELRAGRGEAWFAADSMRLVRRD
jgi:spore coat protein H